MLFMKLDKKGGCSMTIPHQRTLERMIVAGVFIFMVGGHCNTAAHVFNGGKMPVLGPEEIWPGDTKHVLANKNTELAWLGDHVLYARKDGSARFVSIGDVATIGGLLLCGYALIPLTLIAIDHYRKTGRFA